MAMSKNSIFFNTVFLLSVSMAIMFAAPDAPAASAGWEPGIAVPSDADAASARTEQHWEDPETFGAEVFRLVNLERTGSGLGALTETQTLTDAAAVRAEESAVSFSHIRPDGSDCSTIFSDYEIAYSAAGENLSNGFSSPAQLVTAWMNSKSHRANILSEKFTCLGIGLYVKEDGRMYCSQLFYAPSFP